VRLIIFTLDRGVFSEKLTFFVYLSMFRKKKPSGWLTSVTPLRNNRGYEGRSTWVVYTSTQPGSSALPPKARLVSASALPRHLPANAGSSRAPVRLSEFTCQGTPLIFPDDQQTSSVATGSGAGSRFRRLAGWRARCLAGTAATVGEQNRAGD